MHVLIIPSWYKTDKNPVLGSFFEEQARGLINMGCKVSILHVDYKPFTSKEQPFFTIKDDNGLHTMQLCVKGFVPKSRLLNYWYLGLKADRVLKKYIQQFGKPDVIHAHSVFWGGIAARYLSHKYGIPYIITEHLTSFLTGTITNKTDLEFSKKVFNDSKTSIVVSETFKEELAHFLKIPSGTFSVIHNMVAPSFFDNVHTIEVKDNLPIIFFTNSFLSARKNHLLILDAFALFVTENPNAMLHIGGDAVTHDAISYKKMLIDYVKVKGIENKVVFLGPLQRHEVKAQLENCHVFLLASTYETFGVVLIEALASGRPIITTDSKGPREIVNPSNGILVKDFEAHSFYNAMKNIITNYQGYNQKMISEDCASRFSEETIMRKIMNVYSSVVKI